MAFISSTLLAASALALSAGATAYSVYGDKKNAKAAKKTAGFEAGILEEQADDALEAGTKAGYRVGAGARALTGAQRTSIAASGVEIGSGSAAEVIANDQRLAEMDILDIENNAAREALGLRKQAELVRMGGRVTAQGYTNRSYGTLLSGAASLYDTYRRYGLNRGTPSTPRATDNTGGYGQR